MDLWCTVYSYGFVLFMSPKLCQLQFDVGIYLQSHATLAFSREVFDDRRLGNFTIPDVGYLGFPI